jgi:predicted Fe-S protein YdhL (DUF1289 family)
MTPAEKGYALEDALDRSSSANGAFEGSISSKELRKQSRAWFDLAEIYTANGDADSSQILDVQNAMGMQVNDIDISEETEMNPIEDRNSMTIPALPIKSALSSSTVVPPTPCTRICRYNADFYDGAICIGCFRDSYEISNWRVLTAIEKAYALEDAADRCRETESIEKFEGGISQKELLRQAKMWEQSSSDSNIQQWQEIDIQSQKTCSFESSTTTDYHNFLEGNSVITLPPVITQEECNEIVEAARAIAIGHRSTRAENGLADEGLVRIPSVAAASRATIDNRNTPHANAFDSLTDAKLHDLLARVCEVLDTDHKHIVDILFGTEMPLIERFKSDLLTFSSREPAVNVYTKGGSFRPHEDGQKLTVLIPLSSQDSFSSEGTAFWPQDSRGHRVEPPSLKLKPDCGEPILFVGHVVHSGMLVEDGERVVFVASFSPKN